MASKTDLIIQARDLARELGEKLVLADLPHGRLPLPSDRKEEIAATVALIEKVKATGKSVKVLKGEEATQVAAQAVTAVAADAAVKHDYMSTVLVIDANPYDPQPAVFDEHVLPSAASTDSLAEALAGASEELNGGAATTVAHDSAAEAARLQAMWNRAFACWAALKRHAPDQLPTEISRDRVVFRHFLDRLRDNPTSLEQIANLLKGLADRYAPRPQLGLVNFIEEALDTLDKDAFPANLQILLAPALAADGNKRRRQRLLQLDPEQAESIADFIDQARVASALTKGASNLSRQPTAEVTMARQPGPGAPTTTTGDSAPRAETPGRPTFPADPDQVRPAETTTRAPATAAGARGEGRAMSTATAEPPRAEVPAASSGGNRPTADSPQRTDDRRREGEQRERAEREELARLRDQLANRPAAPASRGVSANNLFWGGVMLTIAILLLVAVMFATSNRGSSTSPEQAQQPESKKTVPATFNLPPLYPDEPSPPSEQESLET